MALARWMKTLLPTGRRNPIEGRRPAPRRFRGMLEQLEGRESPVTWLGNTTGSQNWSNGANWQGGVPPTSGAATQLTFLNNTQAGYTANNDLGIGFQLNNLSFDARYGVFNGITTFITGAEVIGGQPAFSAFPTISQDGTAGARVGWTGFNYSGNLNITGTGNGSLYIFGQPIPSGGSDQIIINRPNGAGLTVLNTLSAFNTAVTLNSGNFAFDFAGTAQGSPLTINGGSLRYGALAFVGGSYSNSGTVILNNTLNITGNNGNTFNGALTGTGGLLATPFVPIIINLRAANTFAGALTAGSALSGAGGATVALSTPASSTLVGGSVLNASQLTADRGGTLQIDNRNLTLALSSNPNRIGDLTPVFVNSGGTLNFIGWNGTADSISSETFGTLNISGNPTVQFTGTTGFTTPGNVQFYGNTNLTVGGVVATGGTSMLIQGNNLGRGGVLNADFLNGATASGSNITFVGGNGGLGTTNIRVTPQAYANEWSTSPNGAGNTLVTQGLLGLRPLQFNEYQTNFSGFDGFTTDSNFRVVNGNTLSANPVTSPTRINALVLDSIGTSVYGQVNGVGKLSIDSGIILASGSSPNANPASALRNRIDTQFLDFGARGGTVITPTALTIGSQLLGTGGYTKAGSGSLALTGNNTGLAGAVYLTGGTTQVDSLTTNIGGSGQVIFNGGTLAYNGVTETFARGFQVGDGDGYLNVNAGSVLSNTGSLDGFGTLYKTGAGTLVLLGNSNSNTGAINVQAGTVRADSAAVLGSATIQLTAGSTFAVTNSSTLANNITLVGSAGTRTLQTDADVNLTGQLGYIGNLEDALSLTKTGAGTLTISNNTNPFNGVLNVNAGRVNVNGTLNAINVSGNGVIVNSGAILGGTGSILRDVSVAAGGILNPGVSAGTLSAYNTSFAAGSSFQTEFNSLVSGSGFDVLNVTGSVNLGGATFAPTFGFTPNIGNSFTFINNDGTDPIVGTFAGLPQGGTFTNAQGTFRISYTGGDGNDVSIVKLDTTPPTLATLDRSVPGSVLTNAAGVTFRAVFSEPVTGLTTANFTLTGTAAGAGVFGTITTSDGGTTWAIPVNGLGTANGTLGVDLTSAAGVADLAGNPLATTSLVGPQYTLDHTSPTAAIVLQPGQSNPTGTIPIRFNITFSEPVTGLTAAGINVAGTAGASNVTVTGSGQNWVVSVGRVNNNGTVVVNVKAGAAQDAANNNNTASGNASATYNLAALYVLSAGPGNGPDVRVYDANTGVLRYNFFAYDATFRGGVSVATADFNGDGVADIVTGAGPGGGPHVRVFDGKNGVQLPNYSFLAYTPSYSGGVNVAAGDYNGDGTPDIITATKGTAPHVQVFDGATLARIASFYAYDPSFGGGVNIAAGDVDGDGKADIITAPASNGGPHVKVFQGGTGTVIRSFYAFNANYTGGVNVSAGRVNAADANAEIVVSANTGPGFVRVFDGATNAIKTEFQAFDSAVATGARVAAVDSKDTGVEDLIVAVTGPNQNPRLRRFFSDTGVFKDEIAIFNPLPLFAGGIYVG